VSARFRSSPETFAVEEIPAYLPSGTGEHTFVWIEKRGLTTLDAVNMLARRMGVQARDVGYAGMKDRHATTRQWLSLPRVPREAVLAAEQVPDGTGAESPLRVLAAESHGNKLRVGHLKGNRFAVVVTEVGGPAEAERLREAVLNLVHLGMPNRYGNQRFGIGADNARRGVAILRGAERERDHRRRRLLLSAAQSAVFNAVLARREAEGSLRRVLTGDVLQKTDTGGVFVTEDPAVDQERLDAGGLVVTGPMPGGWAREPPEDSAARLIEDEALATVGVGRSEFAGVGRDLPGTRRPLLVPVIATAETAVSYQPDTDRARLEFELPAGVYATVLLESVGVTVDTGPREA
jgi:tRNA pseudouridine13 synthase